MPPAEVHDPHKFLKGHQFVEQMYNEQGTGFFAGESNKDQFVVVVPPQMVGGLFRSQFIHVVDKKVASMALGYCKTDGREASEAFPFWQSQPETLP